MTLILSLLLACAEPTCETVISPSCGMLEVCVTCDSLGCAETVSEVATGREWVCDGRDRNEDGISDCWNFAWREVCL